MRKKRSVLGLISGITICLLLLCAAGIAMLIIRLYPIRHDAIIRKYAALYNLEPAFVYAVINAESRFNETAVSSAGAGGLMQLMEDTAVWIAPQAGLDDFTYDDIFIPEINIRLGCFYLSMYYDRFGSLDLALCAYNAGGGRVESWLADSQYSSDGKTLDRIPYEETRKYVERVNSNQKVYSRLLRR